MQFSHFQIEASQGVKLLGSVTVTTGRWWWKKEQRLQLVKDDLTSPWHDRLNEVDLIPYLDQLLILEMCWIAEHTERYLAIREAVYRIAKQENPCLTRNSPNLILNTPSGDGDDTTHRALKKFTLPSPNDLKH